MATIAPAKDTQQNSLQQNLPREVDKDQRGYRKGLAGKLPKQNISGIHCEEIYLSVT